MASSYDAVMDMQDLESVRRTLELAINDADRNIRTLKLCRDNLAALLEQEDAPPAEGPKHPSWDNTLYAITINGVEYVTPYRLDVKYSNDWSAVALLHHDGTPAHFEEGPDMKKIIANCHSRNLLVPYTKLSPEQQGRVIRSP